MTKANGNDLDADEHVGIVNNFLHSLFKQVDVFLKEKQVTQATGTYAYRAYLETLLNYGPAAKESQLTAAMFYKDTAGKMDVADPTIAVAANANHGLKKRYAFNQESGAIEMAGPLFCDVFKSERLLLSFVDLKVILNRNVNAFCRFVNRRLNVRHRWCGSQSETDRSISQSTQSESESERLHRARTGIEKRTGHLSCETRGVQILYHSDRKSVAEKDNLYNGLVPKTFVLGMVDSAAFNGDYEKNPFNFKTLTASFIGITVNGEEVPFKPLQLSYTDATIRYIEAYLSMFSGTGKLFYDTGNGISRDDFKNGYALYAADLTPDMCGSSDHFNVVPRGNLALNLKFTTAPAAAVSLVCYAEFENTIHIDSERNVIYDYGG